MKYEVIDTSRANLWLTIDRPRGTYHVYQFPNLGRWYLIKNEKSIAWSNFPTMEDMTEEAANKWITNIEQKQKAQIVNLNKRIAELQEEQLELCEILWDE